ncbi:hypothetical protein GLOIN_2v1492841 [Rhizophagus irregularis DAOM 181602=DAOM 197198]|nr:hypothetical protein GLOIN_2v1492841 [Rhizophagus irregularis DAOM 181602=DAOM 197198]
MDPDIEPNDDSVLLPRNIIIDEVNDITIVNLNIISIISRWIDNKVDFNNKCSYLGELHLPYKFELLLRGNRDGFDPNKFHELCDNKSNTVTFIKIKGTGEILGGYNLLTWKSPRGNYYGPSFGDPDLKLSYSGWSVSDGISFNYNICRQTHYERKIRDTEDKFFIEYYEIFQINKN